MTEYIPMDQCKDGYLYIIDARKAHVGIYSEEEKAFTINRLKFNSRFLFDEYHYDTGAPFGTVKPLKEIKRAPIFKDDDEKLKYLYDKSDELEKEYEELNKE